MINIYDQIKIILSITLPMQNPVFVDTIILSKFLSQIPNNQ